MPYPYKILHLSDLHLGPPFLPEVGHEIVRMSGELAPTVVAVTGDLVQRAFFDEQFVRARRFLDRFAFPVATCPGNHDVPEWNLWKRFRDPMFKYRKYIHPEANYVWEKDGLRLISANSTRSFTIQGGLISRRDLAWIEGALSRGSAEATAVMLHHDLVPLPGIPERRILKNGRALCGLMARYGVDMALAGHQHQSYVGDARDYFHDLGRSVIVVQAGTATSRRGLMHEVGRPSFNWIEIEREEAAVTVFNWNAGAGTFLPVAEHRFARDGSRLESYREGRVSRRLSR